MSKTVFILGAGFSAEAGAPSQAKLIQKALELEKAQSASNNNCTHTLKNFLTESLNIAEYQLNDVPLEDVFTPLDKCAVENLSFRSLSAKQVIEVRDAVSHLIGRVLDNELYNPENKRYIRNFSKKIVELSKMRSGGNYKDHDPVSIISTNWDILLDNALHQTINNQASETQKGVVDYCCYVSSLSETDDKVKPGLEILGKGGYNVKLVKLHGSLNWLQCSQCLRLYVKFYVKTGVNSSTLGKIGCRHCKRNFGFANVDSMSPSLVMPTFLKDLRNPQLKIIWQNAGIELAEATRIVFIGYSLPFADFELRQLLSRMTRTTADIWVVGYSKINNKARQDFRKRYKTFFGKRNVRFFWKGASHFVEHHLDSAFRL